MNIRVMSSVLRMLTAVAIVAWAIPVLATTESFQGQVLSAGNGKLTIQEQKDRTWTFTVAKDAKITRDGKEAKLEDLKNSDQATVTADNKMVATVIEARSGRAEAAVVGASAAAAGLHEGTFVSAVGSKITMLDKDGKTERSFEVATDAKITRDGNEAKLEAFQKGDSLKATTERRLLRELATAIDGQSQE
jgi:hypothetical protein